MKDFFKQNNETKGLKTFVGNIKNGMEHCNVKAGLSFRTRKKNQAKNSRKFKTRAQVTKKLKEIMGNRNLPEFLQNNSRIFSKTLGFF